MHELESSLGNIWDYSLGPFQLGLRTKVQVSVFALPGDIDALVPICITFRGVGLSFGIVIIVVGTK